MSFRQLFDFVKNHPEFVFNRDPTLELSVQDLRECCISFESPRSKRQRPPVKPTSFRVIQASENVCTQMNAMFATSISALKTSNASTNVIFTAGKKLMEKYGKHV